MKTLIAALSVTTILATSAVAKTHKADATPIHRNNSVIGVSGIDNRFCRFHSAQTDPDPRIRSELRRDCQNYESD
jgi:hypothetical protein